MTTDRIPVPKGYEYLDEFECPKCHDETVYGDYDNDCDYDLDDDGKPYMVGTLHGEFICVTCGHRWVK